MNVNAVGALLHYFTIEFCFIRVRTTTVALVLSPCQNNNSGIGFICFIRVGTTTVALVLSPCQNNSGIGFIPVLEQQRWHWFYLFNPCQNNNSGFGFICLIPVS